MRSCPACGLDVEDTYSYCPDDGSKLVEAQTANSSLATALPADAHANGAKAARPHGEAVVLYCGECAAEYPMTFIECPVHHAALTRYKIQTTPRAPAAPPQSKAVADEPARGEHPNHMDAGHSEGGASPGLQLAHYPETPAAAARDEQWSSPLIGAAAGDPKTESSYWAPSILAVDYRREDYALDEPGSESRQENSIYRMVAATLVVALVLFCVVAVYIFFSGGARRQTVARATQPIQTTPVEEPPPLIPTPPDALDYKQEPAVTSSSPAALDSGPTQQKQKSANAKTALPASPAKPSTAVRPTPVSMDRASNAPARPTMPRPSIVGQSSPGRFERGSVEARLIRIRSMRTASGVSYFLTFELQDESGRHAQWERMQVSTRSTSGVSHSQAIPFVRRLGARGALTFTVSVEMRGRDEADWQGRVVCTTTGFDNDGNPLRASFGTNVRP